MSCSPFDLLHVLAIRCTHGTSVYCLVELAEHTQLLGACVFHAGMTGMDRSGLSEEEHASDLYGAYQLGLPLYK